MVISFVYFTLDDVYRVKEVFIMLQIKLREIRHIHLQISYSLEFKDLLTHTSAPLAFNKCSRKNFIVWWLKVVKLLKIELILITLNPELFKVEKHCTRNTPFQIHYLLHARAAIRLQRFITEKLLILAVETSHSESNLKLGKRGLNNFFSE